MIDTDLILNNLTNDDSGHYHLIVRLCEENKKLKVDAITAQCEWEELFKNKDNTVDLAVKLSEVARLPSIYELDKLIRENKLMRQYLEHIADEAEYEDYREKRASPCCNRMGHAQEVLTTLNAIASENCQANVEEKKLNDGFDPDYEYQITDGQRKCWDGEPDLSKEGWEEWKEWERFNYHEERYWRRKK